MSLEEKLSRQRNQPESPFTEEERVHIQRFRESLKKSETLETALALGDRLPYFSLPAPNGRRVSLDEAIRGGW